MKEVILLLLFIAMMLSGGFIGSQVLRVNADRINVIDSERWRAVIAAFIFATCTTLAVAVANVIPGVDYGLLTMFLLSFLFQIFAYLYLPSTRR